MSHLLALVTGYVTCWARRFQVIWLFPATIALPRCDLFTVLNFRPCFRLPLVVLVRLSCALPLVLHDVNIAATPCSKFASQKGLFLTASVCRAMLIAFFTVKAPSICNVNDSDVSMIPTTMRFRIISSFRMSYSQCSAKQYSEVIEDVHTFTFFLRTSTELRPFKYGITANYNVSIKLGFYHIIVPFLFVCQSEAYHYIICLVPHCINQCIYLRDFLLFVQRRCEPVPFKSANPIRPFVRFFERERFRRGDLE